ncbi:XdhC family protein [Phenylobacterium sp.]|uniref:XdhC family protein n=1 Tax=Phenylobacterium sp. TaxID=1871053 RepID=UPI00286E8D19|nr:XdhC family protein [Phenylobacterium sp.]
MTLPPRRPRLAIFGAGPAGLAFARQFALLPFEVEAYDTRPHNADHATILSEDDLVEVAGCLEAGDYVLIASASHELDGRLAQAVLTAGRFRYCGMIGSRKKRDEILGALSHAGVSPDQVARLQCPIGIPELHGRAPEVIAVSVAAQVLQVLQDDNPE